MSGQFTVRTGRYPKVKIYTIPKLLAYQTDADYGKLGLCIVTRLLMCLYEVKDIREGKRRQFYRNFFDSQSHGIPLY